MFFISKRIFPLLLVFTISCSQSLGPSIRFENISRNEELVKNVKVNWNGFKLLTDSSIGVCGGSSQLHYIKNFFGPVYVEWENSQGESFSKYFIFTKKEIPSYGRMGSFVTLYFNQSEMIHYTSDFPNDKFIKENISYCEELLVKRRKEVRKRQQERKLKEKLQKSKQ